MNHRTVINPNSPLISFRCLFFSGNFHAGEAGSVLKKLDPREQKCFQRLMSDPLKEFVPEYRGDVEKNGDSILSTKVFWLLRWFYYEFNDQLRQKSWSPSSVSSHMWQHVKLSDALSWSPSAI